MIEGWSKEKGRVQHTRAPILPVLLEHLCRQWELLCRDEYERILFKAASLLMFFGALRISKVVASRRNDKSRLALQWQDIRVKDGKVQIFIR